MQKYNLGESRYEYILESTPAHCVVCIDSRKEDLERRRVDFSGAKLKLVVLKPGQEVPGAAVTAAPPPPNSINTVLGKRCVSLLDTCEGQVEAGVAENAMDRAV